MSLSPRPATAAPPLAVLLALAAPLGMGVASACAGTARLQEPAGPAQALGDVRRWWAEAAQFDARLAFGGPTAAAALADLEDPALAPARRAAALMAIGAAGSRSARPHLQQWAVEGEPIERQAAILGLGEMGANLLDGERLLIDLSSDADGTLAGSALLALLRSGVPRGRARVLAVAAEPGHGASDLAHELLAFDEGERVGAPPAAWVSLFELRRDAARVYGTIDGQAWSVRLIGLLAQDEEFLDHFVLLAGAELAMAGVRDHILELLVTQGRPVRVRAAVRAMPRAVEELIVAELWAPASDEEWTVLLDEALEQGVAALMPRTLELAARVPALAPSAVALLAPGEDDEEEHLDLLRAAMTSPDARARERAAVGVGAAGLTALQLELRVLEEDPDVRVRTAAVVARLRMGDGFARTDLRRMLVGRDQDLTAAERLEVLDVLHRAGRATVVLDFLGDVAGDLEGVERAAALATLHLRRRGVDLAPVRAALEGMDLGTPQALRLVRALGQYPEAQDLDFLAGLFPVEGDLEANLALAHVLLHSGHEAVQPLLHAAVWRGPLGRSLLAAAVVKEHWGSVLLEHWVMKPPSYAASEDIRRVGFALGAWGGFEAVERLRRRMGAVSGADRPAWEGAVLGALASRTH